MFKYYSFIAFLLLLASCDDSSSNKLNNTNAGNVNNINNINNNVNNVNNTNNQCIGEAPLADQQDGVCSGATKRCVETGGVWDWAEPDYATLANYEAEEITCDGLDNDCDDAIDEDAVNTYYRDADDDGYGDAEIPVEGCTPPAGYVADDTDCDDTTDALNPGNAEICDGIDNNCNTLVDEGVGTSYYLDADQDGYGDPDLSIQACEQPVGRVTNSDDCDDGDNAVHPGVTEICDGIDNNCVGGIDEGLPQNTYHRDADSDSFGDPDTTISACTQPEGYVSDDTDCDDTSDAKFPGNPEICDGLDNDCNTIVDDGNALNTYYRDADGDHYGDSGDTAQGCAAPPGYVADATDCDDTTNARFPGNPEVCDTLDNDCDTLVDEGVQNTYYRDADSDNFGNAAVTTTGCSAPAGYVADATDCDDTTNARFPGNPEICDTLDNDCDTLVDEGVATRYYHDSDSDGIGSGTDVIWACSLPVGYVNIAGDCDDDDNMVFPGNPEICDGKDNNCNSQTDEGVLLAFYADADNDGFGDPGVISFACGAPEGTVDNGDDCDDSHDSVFPGNPEVCDGLDNDCEGTVDVNPVSGGTTFYRDFDSDTYGDASTSMVACSLPAGYVTDNTDCNDLSPLTYPGAMELCDLADNDCDTVIDAGTCGTNKQCEDEGDTVDAYCACITGTIEDPGTGVCVVGREAIAGDLLISEIMIQPTAVTAARGQYFEVLNRAPVKVAINNIEIVVDGVTFIPPASPLILLDPGTRLLVAREANPADNGGLTPDLVLASMPVLTTTASEIELYLPGTPDVLLDAVAWDATWRHGIGRSMTLSPGVVAAADPMTLNDNFLSWCRAKSLYNAADRGTPDIDNDACTVDSCQLLAPTVQHIPVGSTTAQLNAQFYAAGITDAAGQGVNLAVGLGYGPRSTHPSLSSWIWKTAAYAGDSTIYDLYRETLTPAAAGSYHFTFRVTMDGGYSYRYCDKLGNDVYDIVQAGGLLVDAPCVPDTVLGTECSDCIDNDADGYVDGWDPECLRATDDLEGEFQSGNPADNNAINLLDCFYDGDSGSGNDTCETHACCLLDVDCNTLETIFGISNNTLDKWFWGNWENKCDELEPQTCIDNCLPSTPPGCDCFGCCTICVGFECHDILLSTKNNFPDCDQENYNDPTKCPTCTLHPQCSRPCDPDLCELCPGMTELDLPAHCTEVSCPDGLQVCATSADCPSLGATTYSCQFGCCVAIYD
ncbi:putative metal-binding motif-containing protein [Myxococcota bacterium]|nr:putative metal-binding motif-containing protein [Myxococcota bacterium]